MKRRRFSSSLLLTIIFSIIILIIGLFKISSTSDPYFIPDEIGYWSSAAWLNGYNWAEVMSETGYYGYGYGFLLAPLFLLKDMTLIFHVAIIINVLMLIGIFLILVSVVLGMYPNKNKVFLICCTFAVTLYSFNIVYIKMTLSEIFLTFLFVLSIKLMELIVKKPSLYKLVIFSIVIFLLLAVHLRTIFIPVAIIITLLILYLKKEFPLKKIIILGLFIFFSVVVMLFIKDIYVSQQYVVDPLAERYVYNDSILGKISILKDIFTVNFWNLFIKAILGKLFYLGSSTYFLFYWGIFVIVKELILEIKFNLLTKAEAAIKMYTILSITGAIIISSLSMLKPIRIDHVLYGRYIENFISIIVIVGIINLSEIKKYRVVFCFFSFFHLISSVILYNYIIKQNLVSYLPIQISGVSGFFNKNDLEVSINITVVTALISIGLALVLGEILRKCNKKLIPLIFAVCWLLVAQNALNQYVFENDRLEDRFFLKQGAKEIAKVENDVWYVLVPKEQWGMYSPYFDMFALQFNIGSKSLHTLTSDELEGTSPDDIIIVHKKHPNAKEIQQKHTVIWENELLLLLQ